MARGVICASVFYVYVTMYQFLPCHSNKILLLLFIYHYTLLCYQEGSMHIFTNHPPALTIGPLHWTMSSFRHLSFFNLLICCKQIVGYRKPVAITLLQICFKQIAEICCKQNEANRWLKSVPKIMLQHLMQIHCKEIAAIVNCCKYVANGAGDCIETMPQLECLQGVTILLHICSKYAAEICCKQVAKGMLQIELETASQPCSSQTVFTGGNLQVEVSPVHCSGLPKTFKNATSLDAVLN